MTTRRCPISKMSQIPKCKHHGVAANDVRLESGRRQRAEKIRSRLPLQLLAFSCSCERECHSKVTVSRSCRANTKTESQDPRAEENVSILAACWRLQTRHDRDFRNDLCGHNVRNRCPNLERNRPTSGEELKLTPNLRLFHVMIWSTWMMRGMPTCISRLLSPAKSLWPDAAKAVLKVTTFGCKPHASVERTAQQPRKFHEACRRSPFSWLRASRMALPVAP